MARIFAVTRDVVAVSAGLAALRIVFANAHWGGHSWLLGPQMAQAGDLLTAWMIPLFAGALLVRASGRDRTWTPLLAAIALSLLIGLLQWRAVSDLGDSAALQLEVPVSVLTGAAGYRIWFTLCRGTDPTFRRRDCPSGSPPMIRAYARAIGMGGLILVLSLGQSVVASAHLRLSRADRLKARGLQAAVFVSGFCPHCRRVMAWLSTYREQHPEIRVQLFEQENPRSRLLRDRLGARFGIPTTDTAIPAVYTASGLREGDTPVIAVLKATGKAGTPTLAEALK